MGQRRARAFPRAPRWCAGALTALVLAAPAGAADLSVTVEGLHNGSGTILFAVCPADSFLGRECPYTARAQAAGDPVRVTLRGIAPGVYAVQAVHDENDNLDLDRNLVGWPLEGFGFSNAPPMRRGPPRFADAAIRIGPEGGAVRVTLRYY